jgi:DnaJ-domain-containing protein 1
MTSLSMFGLRVLLAHGTRSRLPLSASTQVRRGISTSLSAMNSSQKSLYDVLGVTPNAKQSDIKDAFINQSKKMHPDMVSMANATLTVE